MLGWGAAASRRPSRAAPPAPHPVRGVCCRARLRVQRGHGPLVLGQRSSRTPGRRSRAVWARASGTRSAHAIGNVVHRAAIGPGAATPPGTLRPQAPDGGRMGVKLAFLAVRSALVASPAAATSPRTSSPTAGSPSPAAVRPDAHGLGGRSGSCRRAAPARRRAPTTSPEPRRRERDTTSRFASSRSTPSGGTRLVSSTGSKDAPARRTDRAAGQLDDLGRARAPRGRPAGGDERALPAGAQRAGGGWSWYPRGAPTRTTPPRRSRRSARRASAPVRA